MPPRPGSRRFNAAANAATNAATTGSGGTATVERTEAASTGHSVKPVLGLTVQTYDFAVINGTYQAVMQQGRTWVPVASIPAFIVAQWLMQTGILPPLGFVSGSITNGSAQANGGSVPGSTARAGRGNRGKTVRDQISTGNRV